MCNNFHIIPQIFTLFTFLCVVKYELWGHHRRNERRENLLRSKREKKIKNLLISASNNKTPFSIQSRLKKERERDYKNITTLGFFESDVVFIIVMSFCWSFRLFKFILKPPLENLQRKVKLIFRWHHQWQTGLQLKFRNILIEKEVRW